MACSWDHQEGVSIVSANQQEWSEIVPVLYRENGAWHGFTEFLAERVRKAAAYDSMKNVAEMKRLLSDLESAARGAQMPQYLKELAAADSKAFVGLLEGERSDVDAALNSGDPEVFLAALTTALDSLDGLAWMLLRAAGSSGGGTLEIETTEKSLDVWIGKKEEIRPGAGEQAWGYFFEGGWRSGDDQHSTDVRGPHQKC